MKQIQSILVAYDFSNDSKRALQEAFLLADEFNAKISIIHVLPEEVSEPFVKVLSNEYQLEIADNIHKELESFHAKHTIKVAKSDIYVVRGEAAHSIVDSAIWHQVDLIIVGAHAKSAIGRILLGSVASRVIRYAPMPVFVCRSESKEKFSKILVPIDDSETSEEAIESAKIFASHFNAQIQLIHIVDETFYSHHVEYKTIVQHAIQNNLTRLKALASKYGLSTDPIVIDERASHGITEAIKKDPNIGLVIMTTHGRSGLSRFLMGSTAENVIQHAGCSVLSMHPQNLRQEIGRIFKSDTK